MGQLTAEMERRMLLWAFQDPANVLLRPTLPIMVRLMGTNGDVTTPGTEITGDTYEEGVGVAGTFVIGTAVTGSEVVNTAIIEFNSLDQVSSVSVAGIELWDSSNTPFRMAFAELTSPESVAAGTPFLIGVGQVVINIT